MHLHRTSLHIVSSCAYLSDASYTIIYFHMWWNKFLSNCETVVSLELTYNGVAICMYMHARSNRSEGSSYTCIH